MERDVARTRTRIGTNGAAQVETRGVFAAAFDHWDSRDNDPNLHTHVVIANRVQGPDGRWRTLDSRAVHRAAVAMSERYDGLLADNLAARLGLAWEHRERGPRRHPAYELAAVPQAPVAEFSRRSARIDAETGRLVAAYVADHGRRPDPANVLRLRRQATLATRGTKAVQPLADLTADWRQRADRVLGTDARAWSGWVIEEAQRALDLSRPAAVTDAPLPLERGRGDAVAQTLDLDTVERPGRGVPRTAGAPVPNLCCTGRGDRAGCLRGRGTFGAAHPAGSRPHPCLAAAPG